MYEQHQLPSSRPLVWVDTLGLNPSVKVTYFELDCMTQVTNLALSIVVVESSDYTMK